MSEVIHGTIHGKTIHLDKDPGLPDGETVEVVVRHVENPPTRPNDRKTAAGMLADYPEMDEYLEEILRERKAWRRGVEG